MKTLGIGVDIVENKRFKNLVKNANFVKRTFGEKEIKLSQKVLNKSNYYSKRFAAKEAFAKSIGTGFRNNLNLVDIEILNDKKGKPYYIKSKKIDNLIFKIFKIKKYNLFLSISDEKNYSIAFTIIQTI
tara:strand:- start:583 stop:969 length:387 start_codon:yes stop_codon:yes gene_type:complete